MHGFDWRARQRCWFGHVCLRSGHCWRPTVSSGERKSTPLCPSIAKSCVKVEGRDSSLPGKLLMVYKLQNTFSLPLSDSPVPPLFRWPLELHSLWASVLKKTKRNTLLLSTHILRQRRSARWTRLNFTVQVLHSEKSCSKETHPRPSTASHSIQVHGCGYLLKSDLNPS